jgi:tetratricopeptide (TPR) repeat protein
VSRNTRAPLLAATLIVKNEVNTLGECLESLRLFADEVVVYDTGSTDGTQDLARKAGARVLQGYWDGDFSRARNAALRMTRATWALIIDADERAGGDASQLRDFLRGRKEFASGILPSGQVDLLVAEVQNLGAGDLLLNRMYSYRLARRATVEWRSPVHEQLWVRGLERGQERNTALPRWLFHLRHTGYSDGELLQRKLHRNYEIAQRKLDELVATGSEDRVAGAKVLLDLGRSLQGMGRRQEAIDAYETLREVAPPNSWQRTHATANMAQLLLDEGGFEEVALHLVAEVRAESTQAEKYCDWLEAQALNRLGERARALELLRGVDQVIDSVGNVINTGNSLVTRALLAMGDGEFDEARDCLLQAMTEHSFALAHTGLLLELWHGREGDLAERIRAADSPYTDLILRRLDEAPGNGKAVAALVRLARPAIPAQRQVPSVPPLPTQGLFWGRRSPQPARATAKATATAFTRPAD